MIKKEGDDYGMSNENLEYIGTNEGMAIRLHTSRRGMTLRQ